MNNILNDNIESIIYPFEGEIIDTIGITSADGKYNTVVKLSGVDVYLRGRSEMIVLKNKSIYIDDRSTSFSNYRIPGGGWEAGEDHLQSAIRETQEEAKINVKNILYASKYAVICKSIKQFMVKKGMPKEFWYNGFFSELYIGEYDSEFTGEVDEKDKDSMEKYGKFYPIEDVYEFLSQPHKDAIKLYFDKKEMIL